jgi:hypothetical protein
MRDTVVWSMPTKMKTNSSANSRPASRPGRNELSCAERAMPRQCAQANTSRAAIPERRPACRMGLISAAATLIATCCMPHIAHSSTIRPNAAGPGGMRGFMRRHARAATGHDAAARRRRPRRRCPRPPAARSRGRRTVGTRKWRRTPRHRCVRAKPRSVTVPRRYRACKPVGRSEARRARRARGRRAGHRLLRRGMKRGSWRSRRRSAGSRSRPTKGTCPATRRWPRSMHWPEW